MKTCTPEDVIEDMGWDDMVNPYEPIIKKRKKVKKKWFLISVLNADTNIISYVVIVVMSGNIRNDLLLM